MTDEGVDESKIDELLESFEKTKEREKEEKEKFKEKESTWKILIKYFIHGLAFSLLFTVLAFLWTFGVLMLIVIGSIIGLIIGIGLLMLIVGAINACLTSTLWFPVETSFMSILGHGIVLFIILILVNGVFLLAPSIAFPGTLTTVITFIAGCFIDGFVGKMVASWWKTYEEEPYVPMQEL
jgi:hypothetical protein